MGLKETIQSILDRLRTITVTDPDGNSVALYAAVFNDQITREAQGQGAPFQKPACFLETILGQGLPIGQGATGYDITFRFHLVIADYNTEGMFDEALPIFDLRDKAHRKLNMFKPDNCSHLFQSATNIDYSHDNTVVCIVDYASHFVDLRGTVYDTESGDYIEQTLTDPILEMGVTVYEGALPEDEDGTAYTITGSVSSGDGLGPTVWRDGNGVPADSLGYNGDYYLDDDTGDVYKKVDGVYELRANIMGPGGGGGGTSRLIFSINGENTVAGDAANTDYIYLIQGDMTLTLPTAVGNTNRYSVIKVGNGATSVLFDGTETADGSSTIEMPILYQALEFISDNTNWNIL